MDIKSVAAAELAWAIGREESYKSDGVPVPEPIRRLKALAAEVQDAPAAEPSSHLAVAVRDAGSRLGIAGSGGGDTDLAAIVAEIEKRAANGCAIRDVIAKCDLALRDGAEVLLGVARELGGLFIAGENEALGARDAETKSVPSPVPLRHGLLLKQRKTGHRALISEVKEGWVYQWVAPDGSSTTEPTATEHNAWRSDTWEECADIIEAKPIPQPAVPRVEQGATTETKPADPGPGLIRDWNPSPDEMAKKGVEFAAAMTKAGVSVAIDVPRLVERWKAEKGAERTQKPAMAFYHWGVKTLKGG